MTYQLLFMGLGPADEFRCRVYTELTDAEKVQAARRRAMMDALYSADGWVELDAPEYDMAIKQLQARGWVPEDGTLVKNPNGRGRIKVWRLTDAGRKAWGTMRQGDE